MPEIKGQLSEQYDGQSGRRAKKDLHQAQEFTVQGEQMALRDHAYQVFEISAAELDPEKSPLAGSEFAEEVLELLREFLSRKLFTDRFVHPIQRYFWKLKLSGSEKDAVRNNRINANALSMYTFIEEPLDLAVNSLPTVPPNVAAVFQEVATISQQVRQIAHTPIKPEVLPLAEFAQFVGATEEEVMTAASSHASEDIAVDKSGVVTFNKSGYDYLSVDEKVALVKDATQSALKVLELFGYRAQPV